MKKFLNSDWLRSKSNAIFSKYCAKKWNTVQQVKIIQKEPNITSNKMF
jgi:hypothetical protein